MSPSRGCNGPGYVYSVRSSYIHASPCETVTIHRRGHLHTQRSNLRENIVTTCVDRCIIAQIASAWNIVPVCPCLKSAPGLRPISTTVSGSSEALPLPGTPQECDPQ